MRLLSIIFLGLVSLLGCSSYTPHPSANIPGGKQVYQDEVLYLGRDYLLSPGDELEIIYHLNVDLQDQYRLAIGDQLRVEFYYYPQLDRTLDVRPDGKITIPFKGDITAVNLTPKELGDRIEKAFSDTLRQGKCTVTLIRYGQRIRELKDAIKTASRGQSRLATIAPDGRTTLPLILPIMAAGKTIDQAEAEINKAYQRIIPGITASAMLLTAKGNVFYIFGAVARPGYYELKGPTTTLQGIATAGGYTPTAESSSVLLISRDEENRAVGRLIDHREILSTGNIGKDTLLRQSDVIFVPNTRLSQAALIGDFIKRLIPVNLGFSYSLNQNVVPDVRLPW